MVFMNQLQIPPGINFECTGCGNCCLEWPVPVTSDDRARILALAGELRWPSLGSELFRPLHTTEGKLKAFDHTLEKRSDGRCEFLSEEKRCVLHERRGAESKPSVCQLFPYTFNETPSGVYVSLSFASSGVLFNQGRPLSEQQEMLTLKWQLFKRLFPAITPDWSGIQLVDGRALSWQSYMEMESDILKAVHGSPRAEHRVLAGSKVAARQLPAGICESGLPQMAAKPKQIDQLLLKALFELYLPDDVFTSEQTDIECKRLLENLVVPPSAVRLRSQGQESSFGELMNFKLGKLDDESEDLLYRFIFCRIFAKLYFGPGFANLSLLAGLHHLPAIIVMVRLKLKLLAMRQAGSRPDFGVTAEIVRDLERKLSQVNLSRESATVLEVLFVSPERAERMLALAA
jgi:Fe-S-cluster containining protein